MDTIRSLFFFVISGLCELGGGYLIWIWVREGKSIWLAVSGAILLAAYGFVTTLQPANFGRVYAAYGGVFVILSIFWGWKIDGFTPDRSDWIGGGIMVSGAVIMMYARRG